MSWSQVLLDGLAAGLLGGVVAALVAIYASRREGHARNEERRLTVASRILDSVDAFASAVSRDDEKAIVDARLALLRWTRVEGLYGRHRQHMDYAAWLRAHLARIAILVPARPAGLGDYTDDDRQATLEVLLAIEEATIRWMSMKPGEWSPGDAGMDRGLDQARAKMNQTGRQLPIRVGNGVDNDEPDLSGRPEIGAGEAGSAQPAAGARSWLKPRKFRLSVLRLQRQAARPIREGTEGTGEPQSPPVQDKQHRRTGPDDDGPS